MLILWQRRTQRGLVGGAIAKIAVWRALHDRLRACEADRGVETGDERGVAVAREEVAKVAGAHRPVHLGEAAAAHVEANALGIAFNDLDLERAAAAERLHVLGEGEQVVLATSRCLLAALLLGDRHDHPPHNDVDALLAELLLKGADQRYKHARFDTSSLQQRQLRDGLSEQRVGIDRLGCFASFVGHVATLSVVLFCHYNAGGSRCRRAGYDAATFPRRVVRWRKRRYRTAAPTRREDDDDGRFARRGGQARAATAARGTDGPLGRCA